MLLLQIIKKSLQGSEEMAQQLRPLDVLPGNLGSVPSTHMVAHDYL